MVARTRSARERAAACAGTERHVRWTRVNVDRRCVTAPSRRAERRIRHGRLLALAAALGLACSTAPRVTGLERELYDSALDRFIERIVRLQTISQRIQLANVEICGDAVAPVLGIVVIRPAELPESLRGIAAQRLGDSAAPTVVGVLPGSAAHASGVRTGDRVVRIARRATTTTRLIYTPPRAHGETIRVRVLRDDESIELTLPVREGCAYPAELVDNDAFNAYATGRKVVVLQGLLRLLHRDAAVAFVLGHEMAHNIQYRAARRRARTAADEEAADYLGAYLAERAGYRLSLEDFGLVRAAYAFRMPAESPFETHPAAPARLVSFERTLTEIASLRERGETLLPRDH
jgi:hypothetical protein